MSSVGVSQGNDSSLHRPSSKHELPALRRGTLQRPSKKLFRPSRHVLGSTLSGSINSTIAAEATSRQPLFPRSNPNSGSFSSPGNLSTSPGQAQPLGPSPLARPEKGINFALFSKHASKVTLELYSPEGKHLKSVPLDRTQNRSGDVWHVAVKNLPLKGIQYGWRVGGEGGWESGHRWNESKVLVDPYAPLIAGRRRFAVRDEVEQYKEKEGSVFRGTYDFESPEFDWGSGYKRPNIPQQDLVIYEMGVRSFTASASSGLPEGRRGTYLGLREKIPHLVELGINAVELLPVMEYDELEFQRSPNPRDHMINIWGYSHISFIAPMTRFAADGAGPIAARNELKETVKALHKAGIEVILDVVFNHTAEGGDDDPYLLSMRGIDNSVYYMLNPEEYKQLLNFSGCGNTVSGNHPVVKELIITACKRWVEEYHVDGFRFDLASALTRDEKGTPLAAPPLMRDIAKDPVLSKVKLLAEPWDCGGLYQVGSFPNWDVWGEWNGKYRDDVRRFIKGDPGLKSAFATRIAGSADLYQSNNRKPYHSLNFVIAHDGFTLYDLVSYNSKRNEANGEDNKDGSNDNFSWNCGAEGETDDPAVKALRQRQMRNLLVALLVSQGTPMVLSGDEYGQTRSGNNNYYGHDNEMTRFAWDQLDSARGTFFRFYSEMIHFRIQHPLLGRTEFLTPEDISWYDNDWENTESKFLAFTLHDRGEGCGSLFAAFNAHHHSYEVHLPQLPDGQYWTRVVDTNLQPPKDFTVGGNKGLEPTYTVTEYSSIVLISRRR